jgi:6-phosphogluconolactonase (cycloisomerase 2 family)
MHVSSYLFSPFPLQRCALLLLLVGMAAQGMCQTPQQHVYAAGAPTNNSGAAVISGFDKNSTSGALTGIPGSPFSAHGMAPMAVDGQGKFLFVAGPTSIAMYAIDAASGALTEVPQSPIPYVPYPGQSLIPSSPLSIATEPTGKYVYVGFEFGDLPESQSGSVGSSITPYVIDTSNAASPTLDLGPQWSLNFTDGAPTNLFVEPTGRHLYVALGPAPGAPNGSGFDVYDIDGSSGALNYVMTITTDYNAQWSAMDPLGRFLFQSDGEIGSMLHSFTLSPLDGTLKGSSAVLISYVDPLNFFVVDPSGSFLYAYVSMGFNTYSIDQTTGALTLLSTVQTPFPFNPPTLADPQGAYLYTLLGGSLHGFKADSTSGAITELPGSPFNDGSSTSYETWLYITNTNSQASSGAYLELSGSGAFPETLVGQSASQTIVLSNLGNIAMSLTSITVAGDSTGSFSETNNCSTVLAAGASCQVAVSFTPSASGVLQAALQIADNAPGSPQSVSLSGVGTSPITPQPQVTLSAGSLSFPSQTQGTASTPQVITLTNSGNAALHVSGITLAGTFAKDWSETQTCTAAAIATQGTCTISVTFSPSDNGILSAELSVADDAPSAPQTINLYGNAVPAALISPATSGGSTAATVSAGQTATYNLQVVPGPSFSGTISLTCTGAPFGAACTVPASLTVTNGVAVPFTVSVSTLSASQTADSPWLPRLPSGPLRPQPGFALAFFAAFLLFALTLRAGITPRTPTWMADVTAALLMTAVVFWGMGCGSAGYSQLQTQPPPQNAATPAIQPAAGTYAVAQSVTITDATAGATIYYTTDGSTPTVSSAEYQAAIQVSTPTTIQAMATAPNYTNSAVASATFDFQTAAPVIAPASGTYYAAQSVTITDTTAGATIHYTTDGSTPTASSTAYQAAIPLSSLTTVQAMAVAPNYANSAVASATFKFQTPSGTLTITPTATPSGSTTHFALTPIQLTLTVQ